MVAKPEITNNLGKILPGYYAHEQRVGDSNREEIESRLNDKEIIIW